VIVAAARRFTILFFVLGFGTVGLGAFFALATGTSARRGAVVGLYAVGAFCALIGAGLALRNPLQGLRRGETAAEPTEAPALDRELAGLLIVLGVLFVVVGIAIDPNARLL
jgi:hypothetical protein